MGLGRLDDLGDSTGHPLGIALDHLVLGTRRSGGGATERRYERKPPH